MGERQTDRQSVIPLTHDQRTTFDPARPLPQPPPITTTTTTTTTTRNATSHRRTCQPALFSPSSSPSSSSQTSFTHPPPPPLHPPPPPPSTPAAAASAAAAATSLELRLSSDVTDDDIRVVEEHVQVVRFNYTLSVSGEANHSLALAVCATVDDPDVARAWVSKDAILPLSADLEGEFNVTVLGVFVGRAVVHVHFVVGQSGGRLVRCGEPGAKDLQELLKVSEAQQGKEMEMNVTKTSSSSSSSSNSSSSSVVGLHSGRRYKVAVLRAERAIDMVFRTGTVLLVVIVNIGMGCKLDLQIIKSTLRRPFAPVTGLCSQFIVMPLISFGVTQVFDLAPGVALGFFALGCSPGGSASNVFCYLLGGDVSLSVTMTFCSTVASIGLLPMWMSTLGRYVSGLDDVNIPFANIIYSLLGLVAACGFGLLLKTKKPTWAKVAITISKVGIALFIIFILTVGVYANLYVFSLMKGVVLAAAAMLPYCGFLIGGLVALVLRLPAKHVITIAIETGIQNTGVAMIVLLLSLDHPESDLSIVAPATSALFTPIPLYFAILFFKTRRCYRRRKKRSAGDDDGKGNNDNAVTTSTTENDNSERNPENGDVGGGGGGGGGGGTTSSSPKESLCKKLFGKGEEAAAATTTTTTTTTTGGGGCPVVTCWSRPCLYCWGHLDMETGSPGDLEFVVPDPSRSEPGSLEEKKREVESFQFDNPALEKEEEEKEERDPENPTPPPSPPPPQRRESVPAMKEEKEEEKGEEKKEGEERSGSPSSGSSQSLPRDDDDMVWTVQQDGVMSSRC
ncbi:uncharacterized protein LOC143300318 [Babylonia areolata]|uniref:uncharacterized protein LOC143300318 n=1 Tax=Babylonia areolata TaxID=304850 RepID=UPI003FD5C162